MKALKKINTQAHKTTTTRYNREKAKTLTFKKYKNSSSEWHCINYL